MIWLLLLACGPTEEESTATDLCVIVNTGWYWMEQEYRSDGQLLSTELFGGNTPSRTEYTYVDDNDWRLDSIVEITDEEEVVTEFDWSAAVGDQLSASQYQDYTLTQIDLYRMDGRLLTEEQYSNGQNVVRTLDITYASPTSWKRLSYEVDYVGQPNANLTTYSWEGLTAKVDLSNGNHRMETYREDGLPLNVDVVIDGEVETNRQSIYHSDTSWKLHRFIETETIDYYGEIVVDEDLTTYTWFDCSL